MTSRADPEEAKDAAVAAVEYLCEHGIPAYMLYLDANGWHIAGPKMDGKILADALRAVAAQCEEKLPATDPAPGVH